MKHTPEPWERMKDWVKGCGLSVALAYGLNDSQEHANAARIVACVNACAGMDDPELVIRWMKSIPVGKDYGPDLSSLLKEMEKLKAQRDEMLSALELFTILNPDHYCDIAGLINKAVEVVSKTKGTNP